ncbi:DHA2 family efflux MFS transporter permease subunit [Bacillus sp. JJ722]|uniref:DHA2 family efflux MFS transporter permease subunit n=1 Tax=Bacillus sp. JJ722 TaxID=3122973 RepID=UPI002FFF4D09
MAEINKKPTIGVLIILMVGTFFALLTNTLINVALPTIMKEFDVSAATVQWLSTGYMLVNGILIPTTAFLISKYSKRKLFLIALVIFEVGTIIGCIAINFPMLLIARMIQAAGAATLLPLLMNILYTSFPPEKRGSAMGFFGLVMLFAPAIGPTLSGWIVQNFDWHALFFMIAPIICIVWIMAYFKLHDNKETTDSKIDVVSVILTAFAFGGILYGFSTAGNEGWGTASVYMPIIVGVIGLVLLIVRQYTLDKPMLDFRAYHSPMFALGSVIAVAINMSMFSGMLLLPMYLQNFRGVSAFHSGLVMLPGAILMGLMSPISGRLFDKYGAKILALVGLMILSVSSYFFTDLTSTTSMMYIMVLYAIRMFGISLVMMPAQTNALNSLPASLIPHGTAINSTVTQVSGAIGSSLLITIMSNRTTIYVEEGMSELHNSQIANVQDSMMQVKEQVTLQAGISGINDAFLVTTCVAVVACICSLFIKRKKKVKNETLTM